MRIKLKAIDLIGMYIYRQTLQYLQLFFYCDHGLVNMGIKGWLILIVVLFLIFAPIVEVYWREMLGISVALTVIILYIRMYNIGRREGRWD